MSNIKTQIETLFNSCQQFYDLYITNFKIEMNEENFNKFRLYFLNLINEVKFKFFKFF
jgi:hypothetical protein